MNVEFGYLPEPLDFSVGDITISTLPGLDDKRRGIEDSDLVEGSWIHSPRARVAEMFAGGEREMPYPARVFTLPKTHTLIHGTATDPEHLSFLVWMFGFIMGIRLTDTQAGFLDATPIKPGILHDISWHRQSEQRALGFVDFFWRKRGAQISKRLSGVVHSLFLSMKPGLLDFEELFYVYTAIDGCHAVWSMINGRNPKKCRHDQRLGNLCRELKATTPAWIQSVVDVRNAMLHEALFFGEPLGFEIYGGNNPSTRRPDNIVLEMQNLVTRFVCAILELPCHVYIGSQVNTRGILGVELP